MPHCIIEYSEELNKHAIEIVSAVHAGALSSGLFEEYDIKTRAIAYQHYQVGKSRSLFIHVSSRILSGRDAAQKTALNTAIVNHITTLGITDCTITAETIDMHRESYAKHNV